MIKDADNQRRDNENNRSKRNAKIQQKKDKQRQKGAKITEARAKG